MTSWDRDDTPARWQCSGTALVDLPPGLVARWAPGESVVEYVSPTRTRITVGAWSWAGIAGLLATFDADLTSLEPDELVDPCRVLAQRFDRATHATATTIWGRGPPCGTPTGPCPGMSFHAEAGVPQDWFPRHDPAQPTRARTQPAPHHCRPTPRLTEEVAADIFMGRFSDKFLHAARGAARLLAGSLYARYYDLEPAQLDQLEPDQPLLVRFWPRRRPQPNTFTELCVRRAHSTGRSWSLANNGTIVEQAQILTTHDLAALVDLGVQPTQPWPDLALAAYHRVEQLIALSHRQPRPLPTIKDAT